MEKGQLSGNRLLYLAGLTLLFVLAFSYIFDEKLDMNGDNCTYYMLSTSIAGGHGYADITNAAHNPSNVFPPGYPLLMSVVRFFTDSFFPQKVLNGLFLWGSALLLFLFVEAVPLRRATGRVAAVGVRRLGGGAGQLSGTAFRDYDDERDLVPLHLGIGLLVPLQGG